MSRLRVTHPTGLCRVSVQLPASKSISNRALIMQALSPEPPTLYNISEADDTVLMQAALKQTHGVINLKNAGTCMRFLTAYFAGKPGCDIVLECDARMAERPIGILVDALRTCGADIEYLKREGFPPLRIRGTQLHGGKISLDASVSSQFTSALIMIAGTCSSPMEIGLTDEISSEPYIRMTVAMAKQFGYSVLMSGRSITVQPGITPPASNAYTIEPDWSSAAWWYEIAALGREAEILLPGLTQDSIQGDSILAKHMKLFGIDTHFTEAGAILSKRTAIPATSAEEIDLSGHPDLAPALTVTAAALNVPLRLTGLTTLAVKESDRLQVLASQLSGAGYDVHAMGSALTIGKLPTPCIPPAGYVFQTHDDHRMTMAFAPLALLTPVEIESPEAVKKSYPGFWADLGKTGFKF